MGLLERISEEQAWSTLDPSGQGEGVRVSQSAEKSMSSSIQQRMQLGLSSGEEYSVTQGLWVQALDSDGDGDSMKDSAGFDVQTRGLLLGYSMQWSPSWSFGVAAATSSSDLEANDRSIIVDTDTTMFSGYAQWSASRWFANGALTYGASDNDTSRQVLDDRLTASYDSDFWTIRAQAGRTYSIESGWNFQPRAELAYSRVGIDSYQEKGSLAALSVGDQRYETVELGLGVEVNRTLIIDRVVWTPSLDVLVLQDVADDQVRTSSRFVLGGQPFVTEGTDFSGTSYSAELGLRGDFSVGHQLEVAYESLTSDDYRSDSWMLRYRYQF